MDNKYKNILSSNEAKHFSELTSENVLSSDDWVGIATTSSAHFSSMSERISKYELGIFHHGK